ncbi:RNA polymerase sigma factor [Pirellula sp. SH-Sr6A]|uniref:sigma-70 family RNA polymerase sigma factor n=1 Tax=Pirellula sp. SH-Sr6A TaxID=1632865 RepID=UPI00078C5ED3|nr:sigma-70 family RNA polymerase sigma factor [Pirellula sp. SH-Sr6A]AMV33393.1 RNA polymerase sigma factor [Pirellula sp. SH-Sr6A]
MDAFPPEPIPSSQCDGNSQDTSPCDVERVRLRKGGGEALVQLWGEQVSKLERIVQFRMDPNVRARIDPADVLQEAFLQVSKRIDEYIEGVPVSWFVWLRQKTLQTMIDMQRAHFSDKRDVHREVMRPSQPHGQTSSLSIARVLMDDCTSPSVAASRHEEFEQLRRALDSMNETDREVLAMRHFEQLNNQEVAEMLGLSSTAASNRYVRAMVKLGEIMKSISKQSP